MGAPTCPRGPQVNLGRLLACDPKLFAAMEKKGYMPMVRANLSAAPALLSPPLLPGADTAARTTAYNEHLRRYWDMYQLESSEYQQQRRVSKDGHALYACGAQRRCPAQPAPLALASALCHSTPPNALSAPFLQHPPAAQSWRRVPSP